MEKVFQRLAGQSAETRTRRFFLALAVVLGFLQAWASRMDLVNDTVSYLDMGDGIWHGHWAMAINGLWGPLYAAILGVAVGVGPPSRYWEYPLVHLVVFSIFLFALWSFDFFLRRLISLRRENESSEEFSVPAWVWLTIGYTLFLWSSLRLIEVSETNPDMLVAAFFFCACGLLVRIRRSAAGSATYLSLGLVLGLGYLTKSIMFPVSLLCLAAAFVLGRRQPRQTWRFAGGVAVFLALAVPFIVALSLQKGRITFGESGHYNYAIHVEHVPRTHWQGETPGSGKPVHPSRQIVDRPATFEFGTPLEGTYPAWTDPSYWYDGVQTPFHLRSAIATEARLLRIETLFFFELHGALLATLFVMFYVGRVKLRDFSSYWFLLLPAAGALVMYAAIHIEPRYLAPFLVVFLLSLFVSVHLPSSLESLRLSSAVAIFLFLMFIVPVESSSLHVKEFLRDVTGRSKPDPNSYQAVATAMQRLGLKPGDRIASLEYSLYGMSTWARLARARIVAEVYYAPGLAESASNNFWTSDAAAQEKVIQAVEKTGARVIVSHVAPAPPPAAGWSRVGNSDYYAYWLSPPLEFSGSGTPDPAAAGVVLKTK
jgi:hypothetical protein